MIGTKGITRRLQLRDLTDLPAGQVTQFEMVRGVQHAGVLMRVRADVTITLGAASGTIRNQGSVLAFISRIRISENGDVSTDIDPRVLATFAASRSPKVVTQRVVMANGGIQANTILEEMLFLPFADPLLGNSFETNFIERNSNVPLLLEIQTVPVYYTAFQNGGDRTFVMNSLTVEVGQMIDRRSNVLPLFIPRFRQLSTESITGAVTQREIALNTKGFMGTIIVQQIGNGLYDATDIITAIELKGERVKFWEGQFTPDFLRQQHEFQFGGAIPAGYTVFNLVTGGRLGGVHNPLEDPDIHLVVNATTSAAFVTSSEIRIWGQEFNQDPGVTRQLPSALRAAK